MIRKAVNAIITCFPQLLVLAVVFVGLPNVALGYLELQAAGAADDQDVWASTLVMARDILVLSVFDVCYAIGAVKMVLGQFQGRPVALADAARVIPGIYVGAFLVYWITQLAFMAGLVLFIAPGIVLMLVWGVSFQVRVLEGASITESLARSAWLTKGSRGQIFGLLMLVSVFVVLVIGLPMFLLETSSVTPNIFGSLIVYPVVSVALGIVVVPINTALYYELVRIKEGGPERVTAAIFD